MRSTIRVGDLDLLAVCDGQLKTSVDFVIGMEREKAKGLVGADDSGSVFIPVNNFLFERDGKTALIDAGAGDTMQPTLGRLTGALRDEGVPVERITHIFLTHLHPDHANGLVDGRGEAVYPNAEIFVHAQEFDFWTAAGADSDPQSVKRMRARNRINLKPYLSRIRRLRDGEEALGCSPILAAGHSPGHTCWKIVAGDTALLAWGDAVHFSAIQIGYPEVAVTYDLDPDAARDSRRRILELAARHKYAVAGAHVAAPGLGYVARSGSAYRFEPI